MSGSRLGTPGGQVWNSMFETAGDVGKQRNESLSRIRCRRSRDGEDGAAVATATSVNHSQIILIACNNMC